MLNGVKLFLDHRKASGYKHVYIRSPSQCARAIHGNGKRRYAAGVGGTDGDGGAERELERRLVQERKRWGEGRAMHAKRREKHRRHTLARRPLSRRSGPASLSLKPRP